MRMKTPVGKTTQVDTPTAVMGIATQKGQCKSRLIGGYQNLLSLTGHQSLDIAMMMISGGCKKNPTLKMEGSYQLWRWIQLPREVHNARG